MIIVVGMSGRVLGPDSVNLGRSNGSECDVFKYTSSIQVGEAAEVCRRTWVGAEVAVATDWFGMLNSKPSLRLQIPT